MITVIGYLNTDHYFVSHQLFRHLEPSMNTPLTLPNVGSVMHSQSVSNNSQIGHMIDIDVKLSLVS